MLDIKFICENKEEVKKGVAAKQIDPKVVDEAILRYDEWTKKLQEVEKLRAERNVLSVSPSPSPSPSEEDENEDKKRREKGREIKDQLKNAELENDKAWKIYDKVARQIPNLPAHDVKVGKDETENEIIRKWGELQKFDFPVKDHLDLGESLDLIDTARAARVSGSRFAYLKNEAVVLEFALVSLASEILIKEGFTPVVPPVFISDKSMEGMGYLAHGGDQETYHFEKDSLYLVGTSEQAIGPMHQDEVFNAGDLPRRYVGFSTCFRREAGSYGKDTRGIFRVHQFDKLEMFSFTKPADSDKEHEYLLSLEEKLMQALNIPYQVVKMCSGDLGFPAARKYDIEAWIPSQGKYRETHSTSTCTDFQARRLNTKYRDNGKVDYVHTLNGTGFAIGRTLIAILENYQQEDGSVLVPEILRKYTGFEKIQPK